jgi:hypothetical protein
MTSFTLASPWAVVLLLLPTAIFLALGLMTDAPGEWGQGALLGWIALAAALLAGASAQTSVWLPWVVLVFGFVAIMVGGPPGLLVVAVDVGLLAFVGSVPFPRWLPVLLAAAPVVVALRRYLVG